jgi:hypothetical protein
MHSGEEVLLTFKANQGTKKPDWKFQPGLEISKS